MELSQLKDNQTTRQVKSHFTIWKYNVGVSDMFSIMMPKGAQILAVQAQRGIPQLWALVDPDQETELRYFVLFGTGHPITNADKLQYIGTFQVEQGTLVFHLFEVRP